jgi:hypothetical protein
MKGDGSYSWSGGTGIAKGSFLYYSEDLDLYIAGSD